MFSAVRFETAFAYSHMFPRAVTKLCFVNGFSADSFRALDILVCTPAVASLWLHISTFEAQMNVWQQRCSLSPELDIATSHADEVRHLNIAARLLVPIFGIRGTFTTRFVHIHDVMIRQSETFMFKFPYLAKEEVEKSSLTILLCYWLNIWVRYTVRLNCLHN
jgi:hypothetical protein